MTQWNAAISCEVLEHRVELLLEEWGECHRREPSALVQGYPSMSTEARMMADWGRRFDKGRRDTWRWNVRRALTGGKAHNIVMLAPGRADRQTKVRVNKNGDEWPEHIQALDSLIAKMPQPLKSVLVAYYATGCSIRFMADRLQVNKNEMERRIHKSKWFLAGALDAE